MLLGNGGSGAPPQLTPYQPPSLQQPGASAAAPSSAGELFKAVLLVIIIRYRYSIAK